MESKTESKGKAWDSEVRLQQEGNELNESRGGYELNVARFTNCVLTKSPRLHLYTTKFSA